MIIKKVIENLHNNSLTNNQISTMLDELQKNTLLRYLGEFEFLPKTFIKQLNQYLEEQKQFDHNETTNVHDYMFLDKRKIITSKLNKIFEDSLSTTADIIEEIKTYTSDDEMIKYLSFIKKELQGGDTEHQIKLSLQYYLKSTETPKDVLMPLQDSMTALTKGQIYKDETYTCMPGLAERLIDRVGSIMNSQADDRVDDAVYREYAQSVLYNHVSGEGRRALMSALWYALDLPELTWTTKSVTKKMLSFNNQDIYSLSKDEYTRAEQHLIELQEQDARNYPYMRTYSREFLARHKKPVDEVSKTFDHDSAFSYKDIDVDMLEPSDTDISTVLSDACQNYKDKNKEDLLNEICANIKLDINQLRCVLLGFVDGLDGLFGEMYEIQSSEKAEKVMSKTDLENKAQSYYRERKDKSSHVYDSWQQNNEGFKLYLYETLPDENDLNTKLNSISEDVVLRCIHNNDIVDSLNSLMIASVRNGYCAVTEQLLKYGQVSANMRVDGEDYETLLILASRMGHIDIVTQLLGCSEIKVNDSDRESHTALINAAMYGHWDIVKELIKHPDIEINYKNTDGDTALTMAAENNHVEIVSLLCKQDKINVNTTNKYGETALRRALMLLRLDSTKILLDHKNIDVDIMDEFGMNVLYYASYRGHTEVVRLLCDHKGIDVNIQAGEFTQNPLTIAADKGHIEIVRLLCNHKNINVNFCASGGYPAIMRAAENGHLDVVSLLCNQEKIEINTATPSGKNALIIASQKGHFELVKLLCDHKNSNINLKPVHSNNALMEAVAMGHIQIVKFLCNHKKIDFDIKDWREKIVLPATDHTHYTEIVNQLMIMAVLQNDNDTVAQILKYSKENMSFHDTNGRTILILAAEKGQKEIIKTLLYNPKIGCSLVDLSYPLKFDIGIQTMMAMHWIHLTGKWLYQIIENALSSAKSGFEHCINILSSLYQWCDQCTKPTFFWFCQSYKSHVSSGELTGAQAIGQVINTNELLERNSNIPVSPTQSAMQI